MSESRLQRSILKLLSASPRVIWFARLNSGMAKRDGRWIRLAPTGSPDIIGMTDTGRFFGIEVKAPSARLTQEAKERREAQAAVRGLIVANGGIAIVAQSLEDVTRGLGL